MAKEKQEKLNQKELGARKNATDKVIEYFRLGIELFGNGEDAPYNINELKEDSEFYKPAKELAKELEIDWEKMSHEESNRVMLSLLDDCFNAINVDENYKFTLQVITEPKKKE